MNGDVEIDVGPKKKGGILRQARDWVDRMLTSRGKFTTREQAALLGAYIDYLAPDGDLVRLSREELKELYYRETGRDLEEAAREVYVDGKDGYGRRYSLGGGSTSELLDSVDPGKRRALQESITEEGGLGRKARTIDVARYGHMVYGRRDEHGDRVLFQRRLLEKLQRDEEE